MKATKRAILGAAAVSAGSMALVGGTAALADDHHLRVIVGLATTDSEAVWWSTADYKTHTSTFCQPPDPGGWWHCDDGNYRPALDLLKRDGTVNEPINSCPTDNVTYDGNGLNPWCGTPVYLQAYGLPARSPITAKFRAHPSANGCQGVSVQLWQSGAANYFARFEYVHIDERSVSMGDVTLDGTPNSWDLVFLGRVLRNGDCGVPPHLHQSGGPEGTTIVKNSTLTNSCVNGTYCEINPTGDYNNKYMHDLFFQTTPTPVPTATNTPAPQPTAVPTASSGGGCGGCGGGR